MTKRDCRKAAMRVEEDERDAEGPTDILSDEALSRILEKVTSEGEFESLVEQHEAVSKIKTAVKNFVSEKSLQVTVVNRPEEVPKLPREYAFKYGSDELEGYVDAMENGDAVTVAIVEEEGLVIGFGIAEKRTQVETTEVKIIDVDHYSRRRSRFSRGVEIEGKTFTVGVGHVVVDALINADLGPMKTDATHDSSRYVFKSLGFVHDENTKNPCILKLAV